MTSKVLSIYLWIYAWAKYQVLMVYLHMFWKGINKEIIILDISKKEYELLIIKAIVGVF